MKSEPAQTAGNWPATCMPLRSAQNCSQCGRTGTVARGLCRACYLRDWRLDRAEPAPALTGAAAVAAAVQMLEPAPHLTPRERRRVVHELRKLGRHVEDIAWYLSMHPRSVLRILEAASV